MKLSFAYGFWCFIINIDGIYQNDTFFTNLVKCGNFKEKLKMLTEFGYRKLRLHVSPH
jgi:hypothetical protein